MENLNLFRLEFNEKQQLFHHSNGYEVPNTCGWITITENCSDFEFKVFTAYVKSRRQKKPMTEEDVFQFFSELKIFWEALLKNNSDIVDVSHKN